MSKGNVCCLTSWSCLFVLLLLSPTVSSCRVSAHRTPDLLSADHASTNRRQAKAGRRRKTTQSGTKCAVLLFYCLCDLWRAGNTNCGEAADLSGPPPVCVTSLQQHHCLASLSPKQFVLQNWWICFIYLKRSERSSRDLMLSHNRKEQ